MINNIPKSSGVYIFLNKKENIIYIGKSKNLFNRINSYFNQKNKLNFAKQKMVSQINNIETILTNNELEALLLETNLIKKHKPKYNILMKDDKNHTYIKITNEIFPKVLKTRIKNKTDIFFGPFISTNYVNNIIKLTKKIFYHRSCNIIFEKDQNNIIKIKSKNGVNIPCVDYYIKRCSGPCLLKQENINEYTQNIENIKKFLSGEYQETQNFLQNKMLNYAKNLDFENANKIKNDIESINILKNSQIINNFVFENADILNYVNKDLFLYVCKIEVRKSKITGINNYQLENKLEDINDSLNFFIENNYLNNKKILPLILPINTKINKNIGKYLNLKIIIPQKGEKIELLNLAYKNAFEFSYKRSIEKLSIKSFSKKDMLNLLNILNYKQINKNITFECNDISHLSGSHTVASRSILEDGKINTKKYKKFKINILKELEINDFKSLQEVIYRRLIEIKKTKFIPDLIIIDGGKGQLNSVLKIIETTKNNFFNELDFIELLNKLQIISIAKKNEEIFIPNSNKIINIENKNSLMLIQKLRDEAHRFAINYNKTSRTKAIKKNVLEEIPYIGKQTRIKLLKTFGSIENIKETQELKKMLNKNQIDSLKNHGFL